jgi:hypothetical protein
LDSVMQPTGLSEPCSDFAGHILSQMMTTQKEKLTVSMLRTISVLNTFSSEAI